ncbi:MAG: Nramp family divalent metal transporter [Candidatus Bathyarchaeota archaeon]|nr:Nramp family divalent metal transporter [Candidatus Bathyarchaeota archaeon]MDW8040354.1 Nramp family divalent metal transporter [Nitrososphaerota archaeon]
MGSKNSVAMGSVKPPLPVKEMPEPPVTFRGWLKWVGPALIVSSLSISGYEAMTAPLLGVRAWHQALWIFMIGCIMAVILAREIARWTISTGEDVFQAFSRVRPKHFWMIIWFLINTLMWMWPPWMLGFAAGFDKLTGGAIGPIWWATIGLTIVPVLYVFSKYVYRVMEYFFDLVIIITTIATIICFFALLVQYPAEAFEVAKGLFSFGVIPAGFGISMIVSTIVQPGGGTINLFYSMYLKEKGVGMAKYAGKVTGLIYAAEEISPVGSTFDTSDSAQINRFKRWLNYATWENIIVLFILCIFFVYVYAYAAYTVLRGQAVSGWQIPTLIAESLGRVIPIFYGFFLFSVAFALFDTQFGFFDAIARVAANTFHLELGIRKLSYRGWYFAFIFITWLIGITVTWTLGPGASPFIMWLMLQVFLAASAAIYIPLIVYVNNKYLAKEIRPHPVMSAILLIWGIVNLVATIAWILAYFRIIPGW